ncbi:histidine phosphatase family protein [Mumia zhuanghuii]|uniref:Histidine phosphatase family protein n=1 Tax=Mumia zhuanghuii TaxID=2585211 RepID=A0A5C4MT89_9ACTN|nr:histidine phosphatase family protein [Mumia zhuanghuii]TNC41002.1 histidine phosphatase family protein [Mumia zhuanghuii]TNC49254.1 histidine phosphatase family protein [Mumia zhuanghuii]
MSSSDRTTVHLMRHGEVHNPSGVLYGRLPDYHLSDLGRQMAERGAEYFQGEDITHLVASPLERAQETMEPIAKTLGLQVTTDPRVIEAGNRFEGKTFGVGDGSLRHPTVWWMLRDPRKPSWGEPYTQIAARMLEAMADARDAARGHEAVIVSHQLPIWVSRLTVERRRYLHDPRKRQCSLASVTSVTYEGDVPVAVAYNEPAGDLIPAKLRKKFVGGA